MLLALSTWTILAGTVGFAAVVIALLLWLVVGAAREDMRDPICQPEDVAERLGALTPGQVFTDTAQRRAEQKRRLTLVAQKDRGPAKLATFIPKDVA